ncbi:TrkA family potassium uptake protein [Romboutsia ilealis]|uniref:NAD-binding protein n=1 Tax=Romboutsia faecis TaxID=2764597 RepID=A0ABR7JRB5_9FIRM|nr:NAD-binding protein [Romboutsia faecis]MBC5997424.1 NAD-binding protein [Romboutsia faecis]MRN24943.1 TrkA family potassium uptake protein [Romboutsia ilealis]
MNIIIIGGRKKAEFLLKSLLDKKYTTSIINKDYEYCNELSEKYECSIIHGDGGKRYILEDAGIQHADVVIAMTSKDATNLVICQLAKKIYNVKKSFATVTNPKNVDVFKNLGIDGAISATYIVSDIIEQMATINDIYKFMPIENGKVNILEVIVNEESSLCNKYIKDINLPTKSIIGCIIRGLNSIIPNGNTKINSDDKLIILYDVTVHNDMIRELNIRG